MAKNEHARQLARGKKGMKYNISDRGREANRRNWNKAVETIRRKKKGGGDDNDR